MNPLQLVKKQHAHFGISYDGPPRDLPVEEKRFRVVCMVEEAMEYLSANTLDDEYDALLDLLVFTLGTMERAGFPLDGIVAIIEANMKKELGPGAKRGGFELDLRKPPGWEPPDLGSYLEPHDDNS